MVAAIRAGGGQRVRGHGRTSPTRLRCDACSRPSRRTAALRVLVNNASYRPRQQRHDDHRRGLASGPVGHARRRIPVYPLRAAGPHPRVAASSTSSAATHLAGDPQRVHLSAAKHGLLGLTLSFAAALRDDGVAVNAVSPGVDADGPTSWTRCRAEIALRWRAGLRRGCRAHRDASSRVDCEGARGRQRLLRRGELEHPLDVAGVLERKGGVGKSSARSRPRTSSARPWNFSRARRR